MLIASRATTTSKKTAQLALRHGCCCWCVFMLSVFIYLNWFYSFYSDRGRVLLLCALGKVRDFIETAIIHVVILK